MVKKIKIIFAYIFVKGRSIDVKPRSKRLLTHSTHIVDEYISPAEMLHFCDICLSVTFITFISSTLSVWNVVEISYFIGILQCTLSNSKDENRKRQGHWERKCKNRFYPVSIRGMASG